MNKEKKIIKFKIYSRLDRDNLVAILANNGYKVWVEKNWESEYIYYVCVEF